MQPKYSADALLLPLRRYLTQPQWQNLIILVVALQLARTLILRQVALYLVCAIASASCYRRLTRLLDSDPARFQPLQRAWVRLVLRTFAPGRGRVPLLLDWTWHRDRCRSLWIMLPVGGRAVPLAFFLAAPQLGGEGSQRAFEDQALTQLWGWLPRGRRFVLIGDRGFGSRDRMRFLQQLGFAFVLRVHSETKIRVGDQWQALLARRPAVGGRKHWEGVLMGKWKPKERLRVNVVAVRQQLLAPKRLRTNKGKPTGQSSEETTWFLVTDLPPTTDAVALYQTRMQIEQSFRDLKAVLGLAQERTQQPWERLRGLLWGLMIGMALDLHLGPAGKAASGAPRIGQGVNEVPPAVRPRYRAESAMREGLHTLVVQLLLEPSLLRETLTAVAAKSTRLQARPQVQERRRATPALLGRTKREKLNHGHA